jgi:hypothetical protein
VQTKLKYVAEGWVWKNSNLITNLCKHSCPSPGFAFSFIINTCSLLQDINVTFELIEHGIALISYHFTGRTLVVLGEIKFCFLSFSHQTDYCGTSSTNGFINSSIYFEIFHYPTFVQFKKFIKYVIFMKLC